MPPQHPLTLQLFQRHTELFQRTSSLSSKGALPLSTSGRLMARNPTVAGLTPRSFSLSTGPSSFTRSPRFGYRVNGHPVNPPVSCPKGRVFRRPNSTKVDPPHSEPRSLSQRLRRLSREYGWSALGVYLLLSALDFPFCFAAVRLLGVERIGHYEHIVLEAARGAARSVWPFTEKKESHTDGVEDGEGHTINHGVVEAEKRNAEEGASIWTQLALAYAIHKSFIFLRVPLTAAVTPKVVKTLRRWGWDIGKRKPKSG